MKKGFTLAELLIVLGITGVIAAVLLPAINNLMPDKTKILYLKAYNELNKDINDLISNSSLFSSTVKIGSKDYDISKYPLLNTEKPITTKFSDDKYSGTKKLCNLLAFTMNSDSNNKCDSTNYPDTPSFVTPNELSWWIVPKVYETQEGKASYQTDIYVDVDPSKKSKNCHFSESCKQPDRFKFILAADGTLIPADPMGIKYIETQKSWLKKKYDVQGNLIASLDESVLNSVFKETLNTYKPDNNDANKDSESDNNPPENNNDDGGLAVVCGENFDFGDVWIKYTPYPIANKNFCRDGNYYKCSKSPFGYSSSRGPVDIKITLSKPLANDFSACIGFWNNVNHTSMILARNTCTVKAGSTSCMGEELDTTTDLNKIYDFDRIYTYESYGKTGGNYTYYYSTEYLNINQGFNPELEVYARSVLELQDNTTAKCVHIKQID